MSEAIIRVNEVIGTVNAILGSQGSKLYEVLKSQIEKGQHVVLDFEGIKVLNSGFCNAAVGRLYRERPDAGHLLKFENLSNERMASALKDSIALGQNPELLKAMQQTLEAEFKQQATQENPTADQG